MSIHLPVKVTRILGKAGLWILRHKAALMTGGGIALNAYSTYRLCKHMDRINEALEQLKKDVDTIHSVEGTEGYSEKDMHKDLAKAYARFAKAVCKAIGVDIALHLTSYGLIGGGHVVLSRENVALASAYAALSESYRAYRERTNELGVDINTKESVNEETGEIETEDLPPVELPHTFWFGPGNPNFRNSPEDNLNFLKLTVEGVQRHTRAYGHIFESEILKEWLGIKPNATSLIAGCVDGVGHWDGEFNLDIFDDECYRKADVEAFLNGRTEGIWITLEVDDDIRYALDPKNASALREIRNQAELTRRYFNRREENGYDY